MLPDCCFIVEGPLPTQLELTGDQFTKFSVRGQILSFSARGDVIDEEFPETIPFRVTLGLIRIDVQIGNHGNGPKCFTLSFVITIVRSAHIMEVGSVV